jgi:hypothetical protein
MFAILTTDFTIWYGTNSLAAVILVSGLALLGLRLSLIGQQLWSNVRNPAAVGR